MKVTITTKTYNIIITPPSFDFLKSYFLNLLFSYSLIKNSNLKNTRMQE